MSDEHHFCGWCDMTEDKCECPKISLAAMPGSDAPRATPENLEIRWYMGKQLADWLTRPVWLYIQQDSSIWGANVLFQTQGSEDMCDQLIAIGKLLEARKKQKARKKQNS